MSGTIFLPGFSNIGRSMYASNVRVNNLSNGGTSTVTGSVVAGGGIFGGGFSNTGPAIIPVDSEYSNTFASYFRRGDSEDALRQANASGERATIHAALSVGTNSDGEVVAGMA